MIDDASAAPAKVSTLRLDLIVSGVVFAGVAALAFGFARQGFSFLDDGVWLVGAEQVSTGKTLYRDMFTIYGPAKFVVLAAFFAGLGTSAVTMAIVESIALGVAAAAGTFAARRLGAGWLALAIPVAVVGLGVLKLKVVWAAVMALLWGLGLRRGLDLRTATVLGIGWGTVTWFGLDAALSAGVVALGCLPLLVRRGALPPRPVAWAFVGAFAAMIALPFLWAMTAGTLDDYVWSAYVYPLLHFRAEMSVSLLATLSDVEVIGRPFAILLTGEMLPAQWPAHAVIRAGALRLLCALVFAVPAVALVVAWRRRDPLVFSLALLGAASLLSLVTRGDEPHLLGAALPTVWILAASFGVARPRVRVVTTILLVGVTLPLTAENVWLAANTGREGLVTWERDRAGIMLAEDRVASLEASFGGLADEARIPTVFWPYQPGMNFVFGLPLGTPQITLLGGEVRDPQKLIDTLQADPPRRMVLVRRFDIGDRGMRELAPELWHYVRTNYRVESTVTETEDPAWVLRPVSEGWPVVRQLPLNKRLPDRLQSTIDAWSPQITGGTRIAQTFRCGDVDLSGLQVQWLSLSTGIDVPVELIVWSVDDGKLLSPLHGLRSTVRFDQPRKTSLFTFDPIDGTRGRELAVELRIPPDVQWPIHVMWHDHSGEGEPDGFPEGTALVDGEPVEADLYFATY